MRIAESQLKQIISEELQIMLVEEQFRQGLITEAELNEIVGAIKKGLKWAKRKALPIALAGAIGAGAMAGPGTVQAAPRAPAAASQQMQKFNISTTQLRSNEAMRQIEKLMKGNPELQKKYKASQAWITGYTKIAERNVTKDKKATFQSLHLKIIKYGVDKHGTLRVLIEAHGTVLAKNAQEAASKFEKLLQGAYKEAGKKADVEGTTPSYVRLSISGGGKSSTSDYTPGAPIQMQKEEAQKEQPFEVELTLELSFE